MGVQTMVTPGTVIGDRFEVEAEIGAGGMGTVFRAHDRTTDAPVAVKVLAGADGSADRFVREARLLAELSHPAIVRYLAHGASPAGPFLAMEWLEGEDLSQRLERDALSLGDTLEVIRRTAEALVVAHREGVIHRDIKPSNLFLQGGDPSHLKVLDFGVARAQGATRVMTRTGMMVGTVGYMAPEQARGRKDIDARVDVFALGCVFYECVTGRPAFEGTNPMALLAQLMLEDPPRISELRPDVSPTVDDLVARMMSKDREDRPSNVEAVLVALESLGRPNAPAPAMGKPAVPMTGSEQRLLNVLLLQLEESNPDATLTPEQAGEEADAIKDVVESFGGESTRLGLGPYLIVFRGGGAATDEADRAASCAMALVDAFPKGKVALATGRAGTGAGMPLGPGVESASELLSGARSGAVRIDSVTASLLDPRFEVVGDELRREAKSAVGVRKLLGKPTRCVGRRKEMRLLRDMMDECAEERFAQTMLVTAPAGTGKSRLRHELLSGVDRDEWTVLEARATPVGAGAPLLLARQLVTQWLGHEITDFSAILDRVEPLELGDAPRVAEFLGEVAGIPSDQKPSPQLQVARNDERMKADWTGRSIAEWLGALAKQRPLLLVLEDLHWGDAATVAHVDLGLRDHPETPWLVLALARPEVDDVFPRLWTNTELQRLELTGLSARAAQQLVRNALPAIADTTVEQIVERADGNAFFLEELIRHASEGGAALPETVLAMLESRLMKLDQQPRRVLQAASVLGERFERAAVGALVVESEADAWLELLVDWELLEPDQQREEGLAFRHGLLRDAAYGMLPPTDRTVAHGVAADWTACQESPEPLIMIEHLEKAQRATEAVPWYLEAARTALAQGELETARPLAKRALDSGAEGECLGQLLVLMGWMDLLRMSFEDAISRLDQALGKLGVGQVGWFRAVAGKIWSASMADQPEAALPEIAAMLELETLPALDGWSGQGVLLVCSSLEWVGQHRASRQFMERVESSARQGEPDPSFLGWIHLTRGHTADMAEGDLARAVVAIDAAAELADTVKDPLLLQSTWMFRIMHCVSLGAHDELLALRARLEKDSQLGSHLYFAHLHATKSELELGDLAKARVSLAKVDDVRGATRDLSYVALTGELLLAEGETEEAIQVLTSALQDAGLLTVREALARTYEALAGCYLASRQPVAALDITTRGIVLVDDGVALCRTRAAIRQLHCQALLANGRTEEAKEIIRDARGRLLRIHQSLADPYKQGYLKSHRCYRRTMELASELLPD